MKETKDFSIRIRVSKSEKERIDAYCKHYDMSISELIRRALEQYLKER